MVDLGAIQNEANQAVADILADESVQADDPRLLRLSTGVILRMKPVSPFMLNLLAHKYPEPEVPSVFIESKGRYELNPLDPDYVRLKEERDQARQQAAIDLYVGKGTELVRGPDDLPGLDDESWVQDLADLADPGDLVEEEVKRIEQNPRYRYVAWVKYVAIGNRQDLEDLSRRVMRVMGVAAEDVADEVRKFPDNP